MQAPSNLAKQSAERASKSRTALIGFLLVAHAASAQLISNGAFEDGLAPGSPPAQWNATGDFFHWTNPGKAHTGSQYAYFGIAADGTTPLTNGSGSIEQSIPFIGAHDFVQPQPAFSSLFN